MNPRIAVLASGGGTTAEAFIRAGQRGDITTVVELVICSRKEAGVFQRIADLNAEFGLHIECRLINSVTHPAASGEAVERGHQTAGEEAAILAALTEGDFDLIVQMGYMKRTGSRIVRAFGWLPEYTSMYQARLVNTHPGLLPDTKAMYGEQIQHYILDKGLPFGGQTLHLVAEDYDDGPVIAEHKVPVEQDDTAERLFARVQAIEKQYLPGDIEDFIKGRQAFMKDKK